MANRSTGEVLSELVQEALDEGRKLKDSLAQRSVTVITTSGALVTFTLGVSALVTRAQAFQVPGTVLVCMIVALVFLFGAAVLALLNNAPWREGVVDLDAFAERATTVDWRTPDGELEAEAYTLRLRLATDLRASNRRRSRYLLLALALECAALAALSVGTAWILLVR